jgi:hypothetical protein
MILTYSDFSGVHLSTRHDVLQVVAELNDFTKPVLFDLAGITFISRSAADQLIKECERITALTVSEVTLLNVDPQVQHMLDVVSRTRYASAPPKSQPSFTTLENLDQVALSWLSIL